MRGAERLATKPRNVGKEHRLVGLQKYVLDPDQHRPDLEPEQIEHGVAELTRIGPPPKPPRAVPPPVKMKAPAPAPAAPPPASPPPPLQVSANGAGGYHENEPREQRIARLKEKLMEVALNDFDEVAAHEPKFVRAAWGAKRDELIQFIESLE